MPETIVAQVWSRMAILESESFKKLNSFTVSGQRDDVSTVIWIFSDGLVRPSIQGSTSVRLGIGMTSAFCIISVTHISFAYGGCLDATQYPQPLLQFVLSSFQREVLYKIRATLYLIYPKFFRNLGDSQNLHKIFSKMAQIFPTNFSKIFKIDHILF